MEFGLHVSNVFRARDRADIIVIRATSSDDPRVIVVLTARQAELHPRYREHPDLVEVL